MSGPRSLDFPRSSASPSRRKPRRVALSVLRQAPYPDRRTISEMVGVPSIRQYPDRSKLHRSRFQPTAPMAAGSSTPAAFGQEQPLALTPLELRSPTPVATLCFGRWVANAQHIERSQGSLRQPQVPQARGRREPFFARSRLCEGPRVHLN